MHFKRFRSIWRRNFCLKTRSRLMTELSQYMKIYLYNFRQLERRSTLTCPRHTKTLLDILPYSMRDLYLSQTRSAIWSKKRKKSVFCGQQNYTEHCNYSFIFINNVWTGTLRLVASFYAVFFLHSHRVKWTQVYNVHKFQFSLYSLSFTR